MNDKKGKLIVVSGFSGAGKGTLIRRLLKDHDDYRLSVSVTTRAPREGEVNGKDYFFITMEEFESLSKGDGLLEHAVYVGNGYGTPRKYVEEELSSGHNVILEIEIQGALQIKQKFPEAVLIFVMAPSMEELEKRLRERATESEETIKKRLERTQEESAFVDRYDHVIINDDADEAAARMHALINGTAAE